MRVLSQVAALQRVIGPGSTYYRDGAIGQHVLPPQSFFQPQA